MQVDLEYEGEMPEGWTELPAEEVRWPRCRKCDGILLAAWPDNHLAHRLALKRAAQFDGNACDG